MRGADEHDDPEAMRVTKTTGTGEAQWAAQSLARVGGQPVARIQAEVRWRPLLDELSSQLAAVTSSGTYGSEDAAGTAEVVTLLVGAEGPLVQRLAEMLDGIGRRRRAAGDASLELLAAYERLERLGRPVNAVAAV